MTIIVSRGTITGPGGRRMCSACGREPAKPGQSLGRECHAEYMRQWRAGTVERRLTPAEWAKVQKAREPKRWRSESRQRTALVALRLLPAERAELEARAAQLGVSLSEVIRAGALRLARLASQ